MLHVFCLCFIVDVSGRERVKHTYSISQGPGAQHFYTYKPYECITYSKLNLKNNQTIKKYFMHNLCRLLYQQALGIQQDGDLWHFPLVAQEVSRPTPSPAVLR